MAGWALLIAVVLIPLSLVACGGTSHGDDDPTPPRSATGTATTAAPTARTTGVATSSPAAGVVTHAAGDSTPEAQVPAPQDAPGNAGAPSGPVDTSIVPPTPALPQAPPLGAAPSSRTYTTQEASTQVNAASLTLADLPARWTVLTDTAGAPDANAASCGWLRSRTVSNLAPDPVQSFINVETLSFLTNATAYATEAGAIDCSQRAAAGFRTSGDIARAFGSLFIDPDAVVVAQVSYPQVGDSSIAGTLTGKIKVEGNIIDLTVLIVVYRKGNVTGVVGSARSGATPPFAELTPLINTVIARLSTTQ